MGEPFKNLLNHESLAKFARDIQGVYKPFNVDGFLNAVLDETWDGLELKARIRQVSVNLGTFLPQDYKAALSVIDEVIGKSDAMFCFIFPDFVEVYGQDEKDWDLSVAALERYTKYSSSELAVRPFIIKHEKRMMEQMYLWSGSGDEHVRRLSSEGCRPQLPWAPALNSFKKDPAPVLPVLERLKTDSSAYVRNSVANNLNDISKTHPDLVVEIAKDWHGKDARTDWILKHGCRTLLKKGNRDILGLFGYDDSGEVVVSDFALETDSVSIGGDLSFSFVISVKEAAKVRIEYGIDYVKSGGKTSRKIFQLSEIALKANESKPYTRKHSFADLSTRRHYPGTHSVTLIVNGIEQNTLEFELTDP